MKQKSSHVQRHSKPEKINYVLKKQISSDLHLSKFSSCKKIFRQITVRRAKILKNYILCG